MFEQGPLLERVPPLLITRYCGGFNSDHHLKYADCGSNLEKQGGSGMFLYWLRDRPMPGDGTRLELEQMRARQRHAAANHHQYYTTSHTANRADRSYTPGHGPQLDLYPVGADTSNYRIADPHHALSPNDHI